MNPFTASDLEIALDRLGEEIVEINRANGWNVTTLDAWHGKQEPGGEYKVPAVIALIHSEASEALEAYRHRDKDGPAARENFAEEMADILIRVIDLTHGLGIDIGRAVAEKLARNRRRGYRHGGKVV